MWVHLMRISLYGLVMGQPRTSSLCSGCWSTQMPDVLSFAHLSLISLLLCGVISTLKPSRESIRSHILGLGSYCSLLNTHHLKLFIPIPSFTTSWNLLSGWEAKRHVVVYPDFMYLPAFLNILKAKQINFVLVVGVPVDQTLGDLEGGKQFGRWSWKLQEGLVVSLKEEKVARAFLSRPVVTRSQSCETLWEAECSDLISCLSTGRLGQCPSLVGWWLGLGYHQGHALHLPDAF